MRTVAVSELAGVATFAIASLVGARTAFAVTGGGGGGYESEQGPKLFATAEAALEGVEVPYKPRSTTGYVKLQLVAGQLQKVLVDGTTSTEVTELTLAARRPGRLLQPGAPIALFIAAARPHRNIYTGETSSQVWEYDVQVVDGTARRALCDPGDNAALVVPGNWNDGALSPAEQSDWFTFSCVPVPVRDTPAGDQAAHFRLRPAVEFSVEERRKIGLPLREIATPRWPGGAAAKCIDYGYAPWLGGVTAMGKPTRTGHKVATSLEAARQFHNLCTRAMTADYESNGSSHTIPGTVIRIFDLTNLPMAMCTGFVIPTVCSLIPPEQPSQALPAVQVMKAVKASLSKFRTAELVANQFAALYYESFWEVDASGRARASCLAKLRWKTIDAPHVGQVAYSPAKHKTGDKNWQYCDDRTIGSFRDHDTAPQLFVYSAINEAGLYRFNVAGDPPRWVTTSHVEATENGIEIGADIPCARKPCLAEAFEGDAVSPDEPTASLEQWSTVPLHLYRNASGHYATVSRDAGGERPRLPDGYHAINLAAARPPLAVAAPGNPPSNKPDARAKPMPADATKVSAGPPRVQFTVLPEGYLFHDPPTLPTARRGMIAAKAMPLYAWKHGAGYCTGRDPGDSGATPCARAGGEKVQLGYVLLPAATQIAAPVATQRPDPIDQPRPDDHPIDRPRPDAPVRR